MVRSRKKIFTTNWNEGEQSQISGQNFSKNEIKNKTSKTAFVYLTSKQKEHTKVKEIIYNRYDMQGYLKTPNISNKESEIITALRSYSQSNKN